MSDVSLNVPYLGIIMSMHLFTFTQNDVDELRLLCAYENGGVILRRYSTPNKITSVQGIGWDVIWNVKLHVESSAFVASHGVNFY